MPGIHDDSLLTRRQVLTGAGSAAVLGAAAPSTIRPGARTGRRSAGPGTDGTPEQIHLAWGCDPATSMTVSWASPGRAADARVLLTGPHGHPRQIPAIQRTYTDGLNGETAGPITPS